MLSNCPDILKQIYKISNTLPCKYHSPYNKKQSWRGNIQIIPVRYLSVTSPIQEDKCNSSSKDEQTDDSNRP